MATNIWLELPLETGGGGGGGGVTTLNALTGALVIATGTSGTDFNIVAGGSVIQLNIPTASAVNRGLLSSTDWSTFNSKQAALTIGNLTDVGTDGISITGGTGAIIGSGVTISQHVADITHSGYLSSTDWSTFNNKVPTSRTISTTAPLQGGGDLSADRTLSITQASGSTNGYLSSTDWTTFNSKQAAGNYISALTTDVAASGPGSVVATIQPNVVSNSKLAQMPAGTVKGNNTLAVANPQDITVANLMIMLGINNNIDGGVPSSVYTPSQFIDGGTP